MCTVQIGASLRRIKEQYFAAQQLYPLYDTADGTELVTFYLLTHHKVAFMVHMLMWCVSVC
jgi:hypothetical protein